MPHKGHTTGTPKHLDSKLSKPMAMIDYDKLAAATNDAL